MRKKRAFLTFDLDYLNGRRRLLWWYPDIRGLLSEISSPDAPMRVHTAADHTEVVMLQRLLQIPPPEVLANIDLHSDLVTGENPTLGCGSWVDHIWRGDQEKTDYLWISPGVRKGYRCDPRIYPERGPFRALKSGYRRISHKGIKPTPGLHALSDYIKGRFVVEHVVLVESRDYIDHKMLEGPGDYDALDAFLGRDRMVHIDRYRCSGGCIRPGDFYHSTSEV